MEKKIKGGVIKYHSPDVAERMILLGEMNYSDDDLKQFSGELDNEEIIISPKMMIFIGKLLQKFGEFVDEVKVVHEGKNINSYGELLHYQEYIEDLSKLAMSLIGGEVTEEKKSD